MCGVRPMARVFIDRDLSTKVAEWFGPQATSEKADEVLADARMLATARAVGRDPGIPVAKDLSLEKRYHGMTRMCVLMSRVVTGRTWPSNTSGALGTSSVTVGSRDIM